MRILNSITLHGWSAASWYAVEMMRGLGARGHEIVFLVPEGRTAGRARAEGFEVVVEPDLRQVAPRSIGSVLKALRELRDRQVDPDIVLAHGGPDQVWWALVRDGRRPLVRVRSHDPRPPARHPLSRWLNRRATAAVFVANETQRRACVRRLGVEPERVWRLPPGFDTARWARGPDGSRVRAACGIDRGTPLIASIARFAPQKDHETFFAAAARLVRNHPEVHILAAGYPAEFSTDQIRTLAARHPDLESRLTIWDRRLEEGQELVRAADIGVIHSGGSEAICRVAFEYMAEGILQSSKISGKHAVYNNKTCPHWRYWDQET